MRSKNVMPRGQHATDELHPGSKVPRPRCSRIGKRRVTAELRIREEQLRRGLLESRPFVEVVSNEWRGAENVGHRLYVVPAARRDPEGPTRPDDLGTCMSLHNERVRDAAVKDALVKTRADEQDGGQLRSRRCDSMWASQRS
jgi:hypothetical protein